MPDGTVFVLGENTFPWHRLEARADAFHGILGDVASVVITTDKTALASLDPASVVVDYLTNSTLTTAQLTTLQSAIHAGGGYVGVHCAADLTTISVTDGEILERPEPHSELRDLIGGHCLSHADEGQFTVRIEADHPITAGVDDFTIVDAPYRVDHGDDVQVLARLDHPTLDSHPVVWTRSYGDGRVCYCSIGHTAQAFSTPAFGTILRNAVRWASPSS